RNRLPRGAMTASTLTSVLVWLPIGAAIVIWMLPLSRYATGSLAVLVSLLEVGIWIEQAARFDFDRGGLQFSTRAAWFGELNVSYHVGEYAFSLWLVGLTVVVMAACVGYGFWVGRERPRAYFGLMLFLTGATVGVFVAQDLVLFYAFFEAHPEVSAGLSGVVAKAGTYGMLRIAITKFPDPTSYYRTLMLALAAAALVYGSVFAFRAADLRGVVAYSSLAQSGLIALGL